MSHILRESSDGVTYITLNRPGKLNAFAGSMREDLLSALERTASDSAIRVAVITGAGRGFCAGGDVEAMSELRERNAIEPFLQLLTRGRDIVALIREMPQIVIAAVNGVAAGAGCNLALACDYRIASSDAKFGETFVRIGLHPDWGGTWFLPRIVGTSRALELLASGRIIDAGEAFAIGLVDRIVPANELADEVRKLATSIASGPPIPLRDIKRAVYESSERTLRAQLEIEARNQLQAFSSQDSAEGMSAFFEKRSAKFKGD